MNKAELVDVVSRSAGISKSASEKALDGAIDAIKGALKRGQSVTLVGFGTFSVARRKPRKGKNPRTGQPMNVAGGRTPKFKPSPELKRAIR